MTVSKGTVDHLIKTLLTTKEEYSTIQLCRLLGYGQSTVRQAVSIGIMNGDIYKVAGSYPVKFKAVQGSSRPSVGETLVIREPIKPVEINKKSLDAIRELLKKDPEDFNDKSLTQQIAKYYVTSNPAKRTLLREFLLNFAEIISQDLEDNKVLDPSDIKVG